MEKTQGTFIVIEGTDGSGKSTQFELVKEHLEEAGHDTAVFKFPRYEHPSSYFVKRYLNGDYGKADDVGPYTSSLFYALDRFEAAAEVREALEQGKVVLCDRFSGSNMAHQGTKIANAEQRRGFFIWLDNLEFEMLRIPRPDISFILRVPVGISQRLMQEKEQDIHEADISHLERATAVYDEMAQLFPKDFQRIDCVRSGQLLDRETVHNLLWEKISPLLPAVTTAAKKPAKKQASASAEAAAQKTADQRESLVTPEIRELTLPNASGLLVQKIERWLPGADITHPDIPNIYIPARLVPDAAKGYEAKANTLLGLYAKLVAGLAKHGIGSAEARAVAGMTLPVASAADVRISADAPELETLIIELINDPLPEAQTAGASLFAQAITLNAARFKDTQPAKRPAPAAVQALAEEFLAQNHIGDQPPVQLTSVWPRNEIDLVADLLYEHTGLPLQTIRDRIAAWPMDRKLAVLEASLANKHLGSALEKAHYSWDLLTPYASLLELQKLPSEALAVQQLTPRHGYDIPELIEEAGLSDTFEKCFDLSLEFYSLLQQAGHHLEAQYATLRGHRQRWQMTQNARQTLSLLQFPNPTPATLGILGLMHKKLLEHHPAIAETVEKT